MSSMRYASALSAAAMLWLLPSTTLAQCEIEIIQGPPGFGVSRAFDGETLAIGRVTSPADGTLYVYDRMGHELILNSILTSPSSSPTGNVFGKPVSLDGDRMAIGDALLPVDQPLSGGVYVYRREEGEWLKEALLTAPETSPLPSWSMVGHRVVIQGDVVIAGAPGHSVNGVFNAGAAFVFHKGDEGWQFETMLSDPNPHPYDNFGTSVALAGNVALIGAHLNPGPGNLTGAAFVFRFDGREWVLEQKLKPPGKETGQKWFGRSVALDAAGEIAAIGAKQDSSQNGAVYIFRFDGKSWNFEQKLMAENPVGLAPALGGTVTMDAAGNVVVGAAEGDSEAGGEAGAAHVFRYDGNQWNEEVKIMASDATAGAHFGHGQIWGDEAVISASGASKVYHFTGILGHDCNDSGISDACEVFFGDAKDTSGDGILDQCAADLTGDGQVGVADLLILLAAWGPCEDCTPAIPGTPATPPIPGGCPADLTGNCTVGVADLLILFENWG